MAILTGMQTKLRGSAGSITFRRNCGQTIVSEKITDMRVSRTEQQARQRTKWANIVAIYKGIRPLLNYGFESKPKGLSDYNMFMRLNMQKTPVYLTKQAVAGGACVAAPYVISQGSLPAIVLSGSGNSVKTDIYLGSFAISSTTTVAEFSQAVVNNNEDYQYGDQISFFLIQQKVNADTEIPYCQFSACKVVLDAADTTTKLWDVVFSNAFSVQDSSLSHSGNEGDCAYAWVHSRKVNGKTRVSSQSLVASNSKLVDYQGDAAFDLSRSSYGQTTTAFLTPSGEGGSTSGGGNTGGGGNSGGGGNDSL